LMGLKIFSACEYENIVCIRKSCDAEKNWSPDFDGSVCCHSSWIQKSCLWNAVFLYICMYVPLNSAWTVRQILLLFTILGFIHRWSVPGEYENFNSKISRPSDGLLRKNCDILESYRNSFDYNSINNWEHFQK
jgi:hypothetical protein